MEVAELFSTLAVACRVYSSGRRHPQFPVLDRDTTRLSWREGVLRCLESVLPTRTSPPSNPPSIPQSSLSVTAHSSLPPFAAHPSPPPFAANASQQPSTVPSSPLPSLANASLPPFAAPSSPHHPWLHQSNRSSAFLLNEMLVTHSLGNITVYDDTFTFTQVLGSELLYAFLLLLWYHVIH